MNHFVVRLFGACLCLLAVCCGPIASTPRSVSRVTSVIEVSARLQQVRQEALSQTGEGPEFERYMSLLQSDPVAMREFVPELDRGVKNGDLNLKPLSVFLKDDARWGLYKACVYARQQEQEAEKKWRASYDEALSHALATWRERTYRAAHILFVLVVEAQEDDWRATARYVISNCGNDQRLQQAYRPYASAPRAASLVREYSIINQYENFDASTDQERYDHVTVWCSGQIPRSSSDVTTVEPCISQLLEALYAAEKRGYDTQFVADLLYVYQLRLAELDASTDHRQAGYAAERAARIAQLFNLPARRIREAVQTALEEYRSVPREKWEAYEYGVGSDLLRLATNWTLAPEDLRDICDLVRRNYDRDWYRLQPALQECEALATAEEKSALRPLSKAPIYLSDWMKKFLRDFSSENTARYVRVGIAECARHQAQLCSTEPIESCGMSQDQDIREMLGTCAQAYIVAAALRNGADERQALAQQALRFYFVQAENTHRYAETLLQQAQREAPDWFRITHSIAVDAILIAKSEGLVGEVARFRPFLQGSPIP